MHNNPNTDQESPLPDSEDWQIALEPYFAHPETALGLARQFAAIRQRLKAKPPDVLQAIDSLDLAVEALFEHTQFQSAVLMISTKLSSKVAQIEHMKHLQRVWG